MFTTKVITQTIPSGKSSFVTRIDVAHPFNIMNVKSLTYVNKGTVTPGIIDVRCSITNDVVVSYPDSSSLLEFTNSAFHVVKTNLQGYHTFELYAGDSLFTSDGEVQLSMTLSFVQEN